MESSGSILTTTEFPGNYQDNYVIRKEKLNIALCLWSKTVSLLGTNIYNFALSLYILNITGSGTSFALNVLIGLIPRIILGPFAGVLADRANRKRLTISLDIISSVIIFSLLGLSSVYGLKVIYIYITGFILASNSVFYDTALNASLPNLVRDDKLMKINSFSQASSAFSGIISPVLAGVIYGLVPIYLFLAVNAFSFIFSAVSELFINFNLNKTVSNAPTKKPRISFKTELQEVMSFVRSHKVISTLFSYALMLNLFMQASMSVAYPYIINKTLKMTPSQFGTIEAFFSIGMLIASIIVGSRKENKKKLKSVSTALAASGFILIMAGIPTLKFGISLTSTVLVIFNSLLLFMLGSVLVIINAPILVSIQRFTPDNLRGRVQGVLGTLTQGIAPLGVIAAGLIIDRTQPFTILLASGTFVILAAVRILNSKHMKEF